MFDSVSRTLIGLVLTQLLFAVLLPLALIPPPEGLEFRIYSVGFASARDLVVEAAAFTVVLFAASVVLLRRLGRTGLLPTTVLVGPCLVAAPFWANTGSFADIAGRAWAFHAAYAVLALGLGALFWLIAMRGGRP